MLRRLYDWTLSLAARESAEWWLAFIAFVESSVFVIPAEVLFVPMGIAKPQRVNGRFYELRLLPDRLGKQEPYAR